jgi:hypothetical protein
VGTGHFAGEGPVRSSEPKSLRILDAFEHRLGILRAERAQRDPHALKRRLVQHAMASFAYRPRTERFHLPAHYVGATQQSSAVYRDSAIRRAPARIGHHRAIFTAYSAQQTGGYFHIRDGSVPS